MIHNLLQYVNTLIFPIFLSNFFDFYSHYRNQAWYIFSFQHTFPPIMPFAVVLVAALLRHELNALQLLTRMGLHDSKAVFVVQAGADGFLFLVLLSMSIKKILENIS